MPLIDTRCKTCGHIHEQMRPLAMHPATPPCLDCGADTEQIHLPKRTVWTVDPVVVYQARDGSMRFPGDKDGLSAANYEKQGFRRIEIRGAVEMRRLEQHMNKHEFSRAQRAIEHRQIQRATRETHTRSELRRLMAGMSERGRDLARAVMRRNDAKPALRAADPGFYSEVFSMDRSNRDESRDNQGRRRRD